MNNFETLAHLKNFLNSLNEDELKQPVRFWGEEVGGTITSAEILSDDYINPSGECCEPRAPYLKGGEFFEEGEDMEDEPIVLRKGAIVFEVDRGGVYKHNPSFEEVYESFAAFSLRTFVDSSAKSSLKHLRREILETEELLSIDQTRSVDRAKLVKEYADMILCIISSAIRVGFNSWAIVYAMDKKAKINAKRKWTNNGDGTYSHVKGTGE